MKKIIALLFILSLLMTFTQADVFSEWTNLYNSVLKEHVKTGKIKGIQANLVNYKGLRKDERFDKLVELYSTFPSFSNKSEQERLAIWINLYNFLTLKKIVENPGLKQFNDLQKGDVNVWNQPAGVIAGKTYTLDGIEKGIILKEFSEPRVHFALVCAALGCPDLRPEAYYASRLNKQLDEQTHLFIRNPQKGKKVDKGFWSSTIYLSKLFDWYKSDFDNDPRKWLNLKGYIPLNEAEFSLSFLEYDWTLNAQSGKN